MQQCTCSLCRLLVHTYTNHIDRLFTFLYLYEKYLHQALFTHVQYYKYSYMMYILHPKKQSISRVTQSSTNYFLSYTLV